MAVVRSDERNEVGQPSFELSIDGRTMRAYEGQTVLSVAVDNGILDIPTLCSDEKLESAATCRMCLVEIEGAERPLPSCSTPVAPGMVVRTNSDRLKHIRRTNLEMILSDHNAYCQPPCQVGCPTHIDIPGYLELIARGENREAARLVKEVLPFPFVLGLTCPAPCQEVCRRALVEEEIAICRMQGLDAEECLDDPPRPGGPEAATGKRVAIVGAGPAGLTCAYYLALKGHSCKVYDMMPQAGGMLRYGIPEYRLQKDMMDKEIEGVWKLGVEVQYGVKLGEDFTIDDLFNEGFDAVFLAIGAWTSNELGLEGEDAPGVVNAISYLMGKTQGLSVPVDETKEVVVLGGGFTAFDCTRTSLRLGAKVPTVYRRSRKEMGATFKEVEDGDNEGTDLQLFGAATRLILKDGKVDGIEIQRMKLGNPHASGRRRPVPIDAAESAISCDNLIPAYGHRPDKAVLAPEPGVNWTKPTTIETEPCNVMTARKA